MTAPHYGKRNLGLGTAASPGDTLLFNFASYNDSGDSEVLSGFAVSDIEVLKDGSATVRATDSGYSLISDTGMVGDRAGLYRFRIQLFNTADDASFFANGSWYQVFVDSVTIDGKTVRFWAGSFEIGEPRANVVQLGGDTGAANQIRAAFANGFNDTGITNRFNRIQSEVDTGLRVHIDDLDTGLHAHISDVDTGIHSILQTVGVLVAASNDTGVNQRLAQIQSDVDTGLRAQISDVDTGIHSILQTVGVHVASFSDTGVNNRLAVIAADTDTGIQSGVNVTGFADTGVNDRLAKILADTDTGIQSSVNVTSFADTGVNDRLGVGITFDTGGWAQVNIRKVNSVRVVGTGDTGVSDHWRPS